MTGSVDEGECSWSAIAVQQWVQRIWDVHLRQQDVEQLQARSISKSWGWIPDQVMTVSQDQGKDEVIHVQVKEPPSCGGEPHDTHTLLAWRSSRLTCCHPSTSGLRWEQQMVHFTPRAEDLKESLHRITWCEEWRWKKKKSLGKCWTESSILHLTEGSAVVCDFTCSAHWVAWLSWASVCLKWWL